jgi:hypothetical protein
MAADLFGRYRLHNAVYPHFAWTGMRWAPLDGDFQLCNFGTIKEAADYAATHGLILTTMTLGQAMDRLPPIFTIYDHPADFREHIVVRCWYGDIPFPVACLYRTVEEARDEMENAGLFCLSRLTPGDDPCIIESWI